ncbi:MAG: hypothetical protein HGA23_11445, partial [Bacteroidales bacterium]|nr:hypothetical protein [Bacteroidales bacterium]
MIKYLAVCRTITFKHSNKNRRRIPVFIHHEEIPRFLLSIAFRVSKRCINPSGGIIHPFIKLGDAFIFHDPLHPYTQGLMRSVPNIKLDEQEELYKMGGEPPNLSHPPSGCRFHPRCPKA